MPKSKVFPTAISLVILAAVICLAVFFLRPLPEKKPALAPSATPPSPGPVPPEEPMAAEETSTLLPEEITVSQPGPLPTNLRLLGTFVRTEGGSKALIENSTAGTREFYQPGQEVEGFRIVEIRAEEAVLAGHDGTRFILRLSSREPETVSAPPPSPQEARAAAREIGNRYIDRWKKKAVTSAQGVKQEIKDYLNDLNRFWTVLHGPEEQSAELNFPNTRQVAENTWEVKEEDAFRAATNARRILAEVDLSPYPSPEAREGMQGFQIKIVRSDSVWQKMGFQNGDVITRVNDQPIGSLADLIPAARVVQSDGYARVNVIRNNQPVTLHYYITK